MYAMNHECFCRRLTLLRTIHTILISSEPADIRQNRIRQSYPVILNIDKLFHTIPMCVLSLWSILNVLSGLIFYHQVYILFFIRSSQKRIPRATDDEISTGRLDSIIRPSESFPQYR